MRQQLLRRNEVPVGKPWLAWEMSPDAVAHATAGIPCLICLCAAQRAWSGMTNKHPTTGP